MFPGVDTGFQARGGTHLKKLCRAEGSANIFGVFRVKSHDFTPKNQFFSNFRQGARRVRLPLDPPLVPVPPLGLIVSEVVGVIKGKFCVAFVCVYMSHYSHVALFFYFRSEIGEFIYRNGIDSKRYY